MRKTAILPVLLALIGLSGCGSEWDFFSQRRVAPHSSPPGRNTTRVKPANTTGPQEVTVVRMGFEVLRADIPVDEIMHSLKIWNHVDESKTDPKTTALLARNGLRMGVAEQDSWNGIKTILEANNARTNTAEHNLDSGLPLMLSMGPIEDHTTYFLHRRDGSLAGGTLDAGNVFFKIDYMLTTDQPPRTILQVIPEFRTAETKSRWVEKDGEIHSVETYDGELFDELAAMFTLEQGEFLVVGGSDRAIRGFLLGSLWLTSDWNVQKYETVLFVTPRPFGVRMHGK